MSQADFRSDSSPTGLNDSPMSRPNQPPIEDINALPVAEPLPIAEAENAPYGAVPPPPPARSTLAPVKPGPEIPVAAATGVGTAKGVRWRGELESIERRAEAEKAARRAVAIAAAHGEPPPPEAEQFEEETEFTEEVVKSAPPWLISTVVHLILLLVLALISTPAGQGVSKLMLTFSQGEQEAPIDLAEFAIESDVDVAEADAAEDAPIETDVREIFEVTEPDLSEIIKPNVEIGVGEKVEISKPMFSGRSGAMKEALLSIYGGTPETEDAVALGLAWLAKQQHRNGSWSMRGPYSDGAISENKPAATAMALLAFLGDGNTHLGGKYAEQVEKGMKFLISQQDRSGFMARSARGHERMYAQAQATIALSELYGMTRDSWLRPRAQLAIDFAENAQSPEGGWRYEPKFDSDTSVTGWFLMALKSGESAELEVNDSIMRNVTKFLDTVQSYDGAAYAYQPNGNPSPAMTAEGLLCRQYLGWKRNHAQMSRGVWTLTDQWPFEVRDGDVYYWYYATQVMHHYGGSPWRKWNEKMRVQLPAAQIKKGKETGSWAPQNDTWGRNYGRLYTTCLSLFCLEVYYRHMPLYKAEPDDEEAASDSPPKDESVLDLESR